MLRTNLPDSITSKSEAVYFLTTLYKNGESFHPEDDANDIVWANCSPTKQECDKLNTLMDQIYKIPDFDPYAVLLDLLKQDSKL